jgi:hypothetical protein
MRTFFYQLQQGIPALKAIVLPKRTSQLIVAEVEPGQLDTLAQLAGDFACQRKWKVFFSKW